MKRSSNPRVLAVTSFWPTVANPISGIFVQHQVEALTRVGCEVHVLAPEPSPRFETTRLKPQSDFLKSFERSSFISLPQRLQALPGGLALSMNVSWLSLSRLVRRLASQTDVDIVHFHGLRPFGMLVPRFKRVTGAPTVLTLHGVDDFVDRYCSTPSFRERLESLRQHLDAVTVVGTPLVEFAESIGLSSEPPMVIANGAIQPDPCSIKAEPRECPRHVEIVSISNLGAWKGIDLNLRALAGLSRRGSEAWTYRIIGDGPERSNLRALARSLGIADRVEFLGRVSYEETMASLAKADIFSLPSRREAFGIVFVEAMARGVPVIGSAQTGAADTVRHGIEGYLIPIGDHDALSRKLEQLIANPDLRRTMGVAGRRRSKEFTWERNAERHLGLYRALIAAGDN